MRRNLSSDANQFPNDVVELLGYFRGENGRVRAIPGVAGLHLMPIHWEEAVPEICARARLRPATALAVSSFTAVTPRPSPAVAGERNAPGEQTL